MGPSGSGKSTLMHILAGLDKPSTGSVVVRRQGNHDPRRQRADALRREHIGFVFQFFNLLPMLNAEENILLPLTIAGVKPDKARFDELIRVCRPRRSPSPSALRALRRSAAARGDRARARLASPTSSSPTSPPATSTRRRAARSSSFSATLCGDLGQTVVMVTHEARAAAIADRVLFLADGSIVSELAGASAHEIGATMEEISSQ